MIELLKTLAVGLLAVIGAFAVVLPTLWVLTMIDDKLRLTWRWHKFIEANAWLKHTAGIIFVLFMLLAIGAMLRGGK